MITRIVLTLDQLTEQERKDLTYLLTDAFAEFYRTREPSLDYVQRRYPELTTDKQLGDKINEVERRIALAKKLKEAAHNMKFADVPEESDDDRR